MISDEALQKRMEYMQDVAGWKSIIFLPFQVAWQCVIMVSVLYVFATSIIRVMYTFEVIMDISLGYFCDILYFFDTICAILHHSLVNTRKLKNYKTRSWILIVIDTVSLIPFELLYIAVYLNESGVSLSDWFYLYLNRTLRIYRIHYYFNDYEMSINSINLGIFYSIIQLKLYGICLTHTAAAIYHRVKTPEDLENFNSSPLKNIFLEEVNIFFLMTQRFIGDGRYYNTTPKRICFIIFMITGHFYLFGITLPRIMFAFQKRQRTFFDFWNRFRRVTKFVNNVIDNEELQKKALNMFRTVWTYGKGDFEPELLQSCPTNMRKNAYADMYWDAMRHSELLQNVSRSCKRSLALNIVGDFYVPNTIIWDLNENKNSILYLASGILQIMAEENTESPIMSFSGGTVLGESSLFYPGKSKTILRVATFSEIHVLRAKDFFRIIKDYPRDREIVRRNLRLRIEIARMTRIRRKEISPAIFTSNVGHLNFFQKDEQDSVKWIKSQFRQITLMEEFHLKTVKDYYLQTSVMHRYLQKLKAGIDHTSIYLPLLNLGEDIEMITDQTCLKTTIPWVIDPNSPFTRHWKNMILFFVLAASMVYPLFIAWWPLVPDWLIILSELISILYLCDIFIQISTAIKTKDEFIAKSGPIFRYRLKRLSFYADFISAFPYQLMFEYVWNDNNKIDDNLMRMGIAISLLKTYRLFGFFDEWCQTLNGRFSLRTMVKYALYTFLLIYWSAAFIHVSDIRCLLWSCEEGNWYNSALEDKYPNYMYLASTFYAFTYLLGVSNMVGYDQTYPSSVYVVISLLIMQIISVAWFGEFSGSYMAESSQEIEFRNLVQSINSFMTERGIAERIMKRVWDTLQFQWVYDCGDYLTQERSMLEDVPVMLRNEVDKSTIFQVVQKCKAFQSEADPFIWYICRTATRLALPAGSIIVTYGTQTMSLYAIYKGYVEVNSFLPKDVVAGVAVSAEYGPGKVVPIVIALNQMPSAVTARTLTDCELIAIPLESMLSGLVLNDSLKDFVDAIKELDLKPFQHTKLVFSNVAKTAKKKDFYYKYPFKKMGCFGWFIWCFLMKLTINGGGKHYIRWELFRVLTCIIEATVWPFAFLLPQCEERIYLVYGLLGLESFTWFDFYIKMHVGYYNSKGIYIHHPVSTSFHYITTSLILEMFVFVPYLHSIYLIVVDPEFNVTSAIVISHCLVRIIALYRVYLFISNYSELENAYHFRNIGIFIIIAVVFNCFVVLKIWSEVEWTTEPDGTTTPKLKPGSWILMVGLEKIESLPGMYMVMFYCVLMLVYRGQAIFTKFNIDILIGDFVLSYFGIVVSLMSTAFFLSRKTGSKMNFIVYQYHMKSLTNFLKTEKAEDSISIEVINHFEHEWEKKRGDDLHVVFSRFPNILHEDMMFPVYRKTLLGVRCFENANAGFFRTLARTFVEVHFRKRSIITFHKAVHRDIFFVMSGWCWVKADRRLLGQGSVMGDIKGKGIMTNNIQAQTHVVLLAITSPEFFTILNNYAETEAAFFDAVKDVEDYVESVYEVPKDAAQETQDTQEENPWTSKVQKAECEFELAHTEEEVKTYKKKKTKQKLKKTRYITPYSRIARVLLTLFVLDAIITAFLIPMIMALEIKNFASVFLVHILDAVWLVKIVTAFHTAYIASDTGNLVTDPKAICRHYLKSVDGFFVDVLCIFPMEYIFLIMQPLYSHWDWLRASYGYSLRLLRLFSLWVRTQNEKRKLSLSDRTRWFIIIMRQFILYNFLTAVNLIIATDTRLLLKSSDLQTPHQVWETLIWSFLSVFNIFSGAGLGIFPPKNLIQLVFNLFVAIVALLEKTLMTSEVLAIIHGSLFVKSEKMYKMQLMEKFLSARDISPALRKNIMQYTSDLLLHFKGEVNPWFLRTAPYYIRVQISQDLYLDYLLGCYAFRGMPHDFLKQLPARFQRYVYFPSDVITERGDVDCCMYFVHQGEVVSIERDPIYHGLDYESHQFRTGDFFGVEQGLSQMRPQTTTYRALTKVDLLILNYFDWKDLRLAFPEVEAILNRNIEFVAGKH